MKKFVPVALGVLLASCGGQPPPADAGTITQGDRQPAADTAEPSFSLHLEGDLSGSLEGTSALAGAKYGSYHLSFAGTAQPGDTLAIISLARTDTQAPAPGTYTLGADGDFDGNLEIGPDHQDFAIDTGELVISRASGDALEGRLRISARERVPDDGGRGQVIEVDGSFSTAPAG